VLKGPIILHGCGKIKRKSPWCRQRFKSELKFIREKKGRVGLWGDEVGGAESAQGALELAAGSR